ncbi:hypothetical protein ACFL0Q_07800, partial [Thermodesulfobacteriota bacterium]
MIGCATMQVPVGLEQDLSAKLRTGEYVQKTDHFMMIMDASHSMDQIYDFKREQTKLDLARAVASGINATIPAELKLDG